MAIHAGQAPDPSTGAVIPPIHFSTTFAQKSPGQALAGFEYTRTNNPTRSGLEQCLAGLEGAADAAVFASGLAAEHALLQTLRPGDGVVTGHDLYGGTHRLLEKVFRPWGLETAFAKGPNSQAIAEAIESLARPKLLWIETPTNPLLDIVDLAEVIALAHARDIKVVVDNTFATPALQRPLSLGADYVVHSATKYLGGHSDVLGGAVAARKKEDLEAVRFYQNAVGGVPGPMECFLLHRGVKTLGIRMERHCANAQRIAEWLAGQKSVIRVRYPGLPDHPGHATARRQMRGGFGGMISVELAGGSEAAARFTTRLRFFTLAESLGGVESLCSVPALMSHASLPGELRKARGIADGLVRLSVGIEDAEDLFEDLDQALN